MIELKTKPQVFLKTPAKKGKENRFLSALRAGNTKALFASFLYFDTGFSIWLLLSALSPFITAELHLSPSQRGFLVAVPILSAAIFRINFGQLYQALDGKKIALAGILISLFPSLFALFFPEQLTFLTLLSLGVFLGIGGASFAVALPMAGSNYPKEVQGLVLGIVAAGNIGAVLDGILFPPLARFFGWKETMALAGTLLIMTFFFVSIWAKDNEKKEGGAPAAIAIFLLTFSFLLFIIPGLYSGWFGIKGTKALLFLPLLGSAFVVSFLPKEYKKIFLEKDTGIIVFIYSLTFGGFVGLASYVNLYLLDQYNLSKIEAGALMSFFAFTGAFIRPFGGFIADKISGVKALLFILVGIALCYFLLSLSFLPFSLELLVLFSIFALFGLGNGATFQLVPHRWPKTKGFMTGIIGAAGGFGGFYLPMILGLTWEKTGSYGPGLLIFSLAACLAFIQLKFVSRRWMKWAHIRGRDEKKVLEKRSLSGKVIMEPVIERNLKVKKRTGCPYCGVGCGLIVTAHHGKLKKVQGDPRHPANCGDICAKAVYLAEAIQTEDRLLYPYLRNSTGKFVRISWQEALALLAQKIQEIEKEMGADGLFFYGSGQLFTEDYYVANKLVKGFLRTNNWDTNSRLCMASAVAGYFRSLGSDGPPCSYEDFEQCHAFFIIGSNMADCHPILFKRIMQRKKQAPKDIKIVVVDPRKTKTAQSADLFLQVKPGSDFFLLQGMLKILMEKRKINEEFITQHTEGWRNLKKSLASFSLSEAEKKTGISLSQIEKAALLFASEGGTLTLWSMGINQSVSGTNKVSAIINLHLATGKIGKPGSGPFSLTGQPNAMGGREVGGLSHLLPGYRFVTKSEHRQQVEDFWKIKRGSISPKAGLTLMQFLEQAKKGKIKLLWIVATNPFVSFPSLSDLHEVKKKVEFIVAQDAYHPTETTMEAHLLLPAAQWPEKEGVMTNSERCITYFPKIVAPPGEALPDWQIFTLLAQKLGFAEAFPYKKSEEIFEEYKLLTKDTPIDITGLSYDLLKEKPCQWPFPKGAQEGIKRLYTNFSFPTESGKARFISELSSSPAEVPNENFPLQLTTGRLPSHWHTLTRTGKVRALRKLASEPHLEISKEEAQRRGIKKGELVEVVSRRGSIRVKAKVTSSLNQHTLFLPFHWGSLNGTNRAANTLTLTNYDPFSHQPELKHCAVEIKKVREKEKDEQS